MKYNWLIILIFLCALTAQAQGPSSLEPAAEREQAVLNEDGGRSYLVLPANAPMIGAIKAKALGISDLQQHSLFVGSGWSDQALRQREKSLSRLLLNLPAHPELQELLDSGINLYGPTWSVEKPDVTGDRAISDLEIQNILGQSLKDGAPLDAKSLFMVFLDPTLHSTLGPLAAEKHYLAYHGYLNSAGARIHYAVVPFEADPKAAYQIAVRTMIVAALHTDAP